MLAVLPQIPAARSIFGATIRPLNLTEQALFSHQRSKAGQAWRLVLDRMGEFRRPRRILPWVGAKSADRDLPMPSLRQYLLMRVPMRRRAEQAVDETDLVDEEKPEPHAHDACHPADVAVPGRK